MRSRATQQAHNNKTTTTKNKLVQLNDQEPEFTGAYIRSLVKQLSSSRNTKPPTMNPRPVYRVRETRAQQQPQQPPQPPRKQVRRRLHTSRPYQEKILNMAEARREIVTALKFHRASMKQASEQQQQQLLQQQQERQQQLLQQQGFQYPYQASSPPLHPESHPYGIPPFPYPPPPQGTPLPWDSSFQPMSFLENLNLPLPNQPLGLNLNYQDFNLDTTLYHYNETPSVYSNSPQTSSSSHTLSGIEEEAHSMMIPPTDDVMTAGGFHSMVGEDENHAGEPQQTGWNDGLDISEWFNVTDSMEIKQERGMEYDGFNVFDEVMEFPTWMMNANESSDFLQHHLDDDSLGVQEPPLPCMLFEEIDGLDAEWLA